MFRQRGLVRRRASEGHKPPCAIRGALTAALAALAAGCSESPEINARFTADACRRVSLLDEDSGARIKGAEDLAIDKRTQRLFVSAYDRRAVEKAARRGAKAIPQGGLYQLPLKALLESEGSSLSVRPAAIADEIPGGLRPHGLSFDPLADEIVFINRAYHRIDGRWRMTPRIERVGADGAAFIGLSERARCGANDVSATAGEALATFDHAACGWRAGLEDIFSLKRSGVAAGDYVLFDNAQFANGLARTSAGDLVLAATRERAIYVMDETSKGLKPRKRIAVPGGPDNLTVAADGAVVAAVHPSLVKMGAHRKLGIGRAPSRIVKAEPETGRVEILFDDPTGALFSAATVGVLWNGALIAGSVLDEGLLVCKSAPGR